MAEFVNAFNELNSDAEDYYFAHVDAAPEIDDQADALAVEDLAAETAENDLENNLENDLEAMQAAAEALESIDPTEFIATEQALFEALVESVDEEGEFMAFESHDSHAFDSLATSQAAQRYKIYLENIGSDSVVTGPQGKNETSNMQRQYTQQMFAEYLAQSSQRIADIDAQIEALDNDIASLENDIAELNRLLAQYAIRRDELETDLDAREAEREEVEADLAEQAEDLDEAEEDLEDAEADADAAKAVADEALQNGSPAEIAQTQRAAEEARLRADDARGRFDELREDFNYTRDRLRDIDADIERLEAELDALDDETAEAQQERLALQEELEPLLENRQELLTERQTLYAQERSLIEADPQAYAAQFSSWVNYQAEQGDQQMIDFKSQLEANADNDPFSYLSSMESLNQQRLTETQTELQELREELENAEREVELREQRVEDAEERLEEANASGDELEITRSERALMREVDGLASAMERMSAARDAVISGIDEINDIETEIAEQYSRIEELSDDTAADLEAIQEARQQIEILNQNRVELLEERQRLLETEREFQQEDPETYKESFTAWLGQQVEQGREWAGNMLSGYTEDTEANTSEAETENQTGGFLDNFYNQTSTSLAEAQESLAAATAAYQAAEAEYQAALEASAYDTVGGADLAGHELQELHSEAIQIEDENGVDQYIVLGEYDEDGNQTGIIVRDMTDLQGEMLLVNLEDMTPEQQALVREHIEAAQAESPDGTITLVNADDYAAASNQANEATMAAAENEQWNETYGRLMPGTTRLEAATASMQIAGEELAEAQSETITAASADGEGIETDISLSDKYKHAGEPRDEPLDNPTPTPEAEVAYTQNGSMSPVVRDDPAALM